VWISIPAESNPKEPKMNVNISAGNVTVLSIQGDVDSTSFQQLIEKANPVLAQGYKNLIVEMSGVNYVSSAGLVAFQTISGKAAGMGGKLVFAGLVKDVAHVFEMSGFSTMLKVYPDLATAKASFAQA
jgi:anti-sigma B factor antagonist